MVYLSRIEVGGTPRDNLCRCGKIADGSLETAMPGYPKLTVRLLTPERTQEQSGQGRNYDELVQHLIARETGFISWERLEELEAQAAISAKRGFTAAAWKMLSTEQRAELLRKL